MNPSSEHDISLDEENRDVFLLGVNLRKYFPLKTGRVFGKAPKLRAVDNVTISLKKGEITGLVGESGCGKTTLGRLILRLTDSTSGALFFDAPSAETRKYLELARRRGESGQSDSQRFWNNPSDERNREAIFDLQLQSQKDERVPAKDAYCFSGSKFLTRSQNGS